MAFVVYGAVATFHAGRASAGYLLGGSSLLTGTPQMIGFYFLWAFPLTVEQFIGHSGFSYSWKKLPFLIRITEHFDLSLSLHTSCITTKST